MYCDIAIECYTRPGRRGIDMITLNEAQSRELRDAKNGVRALDPSSGEQYVLVRADLYERMQALLSSEDEDV